MTAAETAALLEQTFGPAVTGKKLDALDPFVTLDPVRLVEVCTFLRDDPDLAFDYYDFTAGVDLGEGGFEVITHLYSTAHKHNARLKVGCGRENPTCPSISGVYPGANWGERETWELFGIHFEGHPHLVKLLLPEPFEGHPLRKDFELMSRVAKPWPGAPEGEEAEDDE